MINDFILGRPWQDAPRTVFIRTEEPAALLPAGWSLWNVPPALYAEYQCYGPGSSTSGRISASRQLTDEEAQEYTIANIFSRNSFPDYAYDWIPETLDDITSVNTHQKPDRIPEKLSLEQNYPNPFNPETIISYSLPKRIHVRLRIFNTLGQEVRTLVDIVQSAGIKQVRWDGRDQAGNRLASGVYLYQIQTASFSATRKMIMLK